jgi:outer membrane protein OmpA-like peptidoglycan-associated protein
MSELEPLETSKLFHLPGENLPAWLAVSFALMGMLLAGGAVWLWLGEQPMLQAGHMPPDPAMARPSSNLTSEKAPEESRKEPVEEMPLMSSAVKGMVPTHTVPQGDLAPAPPETKAAAQAEDRLVQCPGDMIILFRRGSAVPIKHDRSESFLEIQQFLNMYPQARVYVEGHADSTGTENYNLLLSYWRAKAVVALLKKAGVKDEQVQIRAAGIEEPKVGVPASSGENRRVVVQIEGIDNCAATTTESMRR